MLLIVFQNALRFQKLIFFGKFLCSEEPPILLKSTINGVTQFSNIVEYKKIKEPETVLENEVYDSKNIKFFESEHSKDIIAGSEVRKLLLRKDELEQKQKIREKYNERLQVNSKMALS